MLLIISQRVYNLCDNNVPVNILASNLWIHFSNSISRKARERDELHKRIGCPTADMDNIYNDIDDTPESWGAQNEGIIL